MSTEQSIQPELIDQTRQQIRTLVAEIEELARSQGSPEEFYEGFLHRVVAALGGHRRRRLDAGRRRAADP